MITNAPMTSQKRQLNRLDTVRTRIEVTLGADPHQ